MKLIITGALGHIGSYLFRQLLKKDFINQIYLIDNIQSQRFCSLFNLPNNSKIKFIDMDLSKKYIDFKADIILHFAAKTDAAQSHKYEKEFSKNRKITNNIINYCNKYKVKMIFASSTSVYGPQDNIVNENCSNKDLKPQSPYASVKLKEEKDIIKKCNYSYLILRLGTIYGFSEGIRFHTAVNKFCFQACQGLPITVWKTALYQKRPYLSLNDLNRSILHIIEKNLIKNKIYNLVSDNYTVKEIINSIELSFKNVQIKFVNHKIMNQLSYVVETKKFTSTNFNFKPNLLINIKKTINKLSHF